MGIDKVFKQVQQAQKVSSNTTNENDKFFLPYQWDKGCNIITKRLTNYFQITPR